MVKKKPYSEPDSKAERYERIVATEKPASNKETKKSPTSPKEAEVESHGTSSHHFLNDPNWNR